MLVKDLVKLIDISISNGETLLSVNAIAGTTTVLGALDPIAEVSQVCRNYGLWLHVGGS